MKQQEQINSLNEIIQSGTNHQQSQKEELDTLRSEFDNYKLQTQEQLQKYTTLCHELQSTVLANQTKQTTAISAISHVIAGVQKKGYLDSTCDSFSTTFPNTEDLSNTFSATEDFSNTEDFSTTFDGNEIYRYSTTDDLT